MTKTVCVHEERGEDSKGEGKDRNGSMCSPLGAWVADAIANGEGWRKNTFGNVLNHMTIWFDLAPVRTQHLS